MVKIEVGGDLDKQYASVATRFFYYYKFNVFFMRITMYLLRKKLTISDSDSEKVGCLKKCTLVCFGINEMIRVSGKIARFC